MQLSKVSKFLTVGHGKILNRNQLLKSQIRSSSHGNSDFQQTSIVYTMFGAGLAGIFGMNKDEDELVEDVIDVETGVEVAKENKRDRSKKLKTALEKEKPKNRGRPPKSKKKFKIL
ncbi:hypothetical protein BpHYR1_027637 [Brachionus plicatilis]|uniref:Uncharacterized protein n=1 Tax=Brachionus plicatilis TaxID=10195 RepID=A0A3M7S378_BRAPC|nr:hypothetical protein BpHYR1_027637 [Brachionus plicatilis]